ncbi:MAG TPA: LysR family transcriptional regulator [Polyangiaceae bacterium]|nr:LysR family transcriptional regulator [Polyangiaceae bacterium]
MNLALLRTFVAVAEARSFTAAARALKVPTSSASRGVAKLEEVLGTKLFERSTRHTTLSPAGQVYYQHVTTALGALDDGESRVHELLGQPKGELKLSVPINLDGGFLAKQLVTFSHRYPQVRLSVVPTNRWVDLNVEGFDLALRIQQHRDEAREMRELGAFHAWVVGSPGYLKSHGRPLQPRDLRKHRFVNMQSHRFALRLLGPSGPEVVDVAGPLIANDMHFARQLVEQGAGLGPLVFSPGEQPDLGKSLVRVLPEYVVEGPKLFLVTSRINQPLRLKLLWEFLVNAYTKGREPSADASA